MTPTEKLKAISDLLDQWRHNPPPPEVIVSKLSDIATPPPAITQATITTALSSLLLTHSPLQGRGGLAAGGTWVDGKWFYFHLSVLRATLRTMGYRHRRSDATSILHAMGGHRQQIKISDEVFTVWAIPEHLV